MNIKKLTTRPGFEFIFAAGIAAIFILPAAVMAQDNKSIDITIANGDTVINGKNIKDMSPEQRQQAMSDLNKITGKGKGQYKEYRFERRGNAAPVVATDGLGTTDLNIVKTPNGYVVQPQEKQLHVRRVIRRDTAIVVRDRRGNGHNDDNLMIPPAPPIENFSRRNTQEFEYTNIDNDGVETGVSFRVSDPKGPRLKGIAGVDKTDLVISDLKIVPDFVSGKTLFMFTLPTKAVAEVEFMDNSGKTLWTEKTSSGTFSKNFALPLNGVYNLKIKQSGKMAVKQIFKEE
ncbi:T9SS type A sorting domain-containing protein [Mucilaginibacter jinjuensis]|uniref:T9SS type A sorting domain-containing protein n=1 Tax=Mucilaginibacter jinjuensis TaxID=1176721 RepID=A0ABY7T8E9_9SPHI|nr:T9SS type A sorting domain-containing protein [Mucilaginibacter jinjuensis]WCT12558.1 T9SS type A sorting domain-containing protein [Mucilaginibacter jinjuensis]